MPGLDLITAVETDISKVQADQAALATDTASQTSDEAALSADLNQNGPLVKINPDGSATIYTYAQANPGFTASPARVAS